MIASGITVVNSCTDTTVPRVPPSISLKRLTTATMGRSWRISASCRYRSSTRCRIAGDSASSLMLPLLRTRALCPVGGALRAETA
ncbi:hypothetical protein [Mycolicibacterium llatzerense]|uniref:hypothetical protein n=1 Tax=Mycolicibacterium llatzerense TaxID=280871 RepID=UPI0008DD7E3C|nr:hypothetical protein [Mycolicibacterium llatzerense]